MSARACLDADRQPHLLHRRHQVARDVGGERFQRTHVKRVQGGGWARVGQGYPGREGNPQRLAAAGGAISSTFSPLAAAWSRASWCGRGDQPRAANQVVKSSGNVPGIGGL
ncbi:MAG: hypothetical protein WDN04_27140 [Rhodospirillales bacterium]